MTIIKRFEALVVLFHQYSKHDNNYVKDEVTKNDRNLTSATVTRICGSCKIARKIIEQFDTECGIKERSGEHVKKSDAQESGCSIL